MKTEDKCIALVASSGGGTAMLGGTNAVELMSQVNEELGKLKSSTSSSSCKLKYAIYVGLPGGASMDNIRSIEDAKVCIFSGECRFTECHYPLAKVTF